MSWHGGIGAHPIAWCCRWHRRYTNEKVGTAGTPTGLDNTLSAFKKARGTMSH